MQRARAGSVGSADVYELFKRKRDENLVTDSEPFAPSKRLERSPVRNQAHGRGEDSGESQLLERVIERSPVRNQAHGRGEDSGESQLLERVIEELQGRIVENLNY
ncbi:hypothetical protein QE152_g7852 [Popillia japonica]|uniref:Uncharacterized protein n=1 Tax=Popillia japonica TaxID=7064 RepID=A0AAW1M7E4_POPJA